MMRLKFDWNNILQAGLRFLVVLGFMACLGGVSAQEKANFHPLDLSKFYAESFGELSSERPWT